MPPHGGGRRRLLVLGGSLHHPGGLEAYCERAAAAVQLHSRRWTAAWWPSETAYFKPARMAAVRDVWRRLDQVEADLVWLQWSNLLDLVLLQRLHAQGLPVLVTPHLGAASRLQRLPLLRRLSTRLLAQADRLALLFDAQDREIALPPALPRDRIGTFLPEEALSESIAPREGSHLRLIHAGRLSREKGTFRMVELCAALRDRGMPVSARIVGRAEPAVMAELNQAISAADLGDVLHLTEWLDGPALRAALGEADVMVHLSELDSFPLIVLEALAAGALPVVADMAGAADMVRRYDGLVTRGSSVAAAADWLAGQELAAIRRRGAEAAVQVRAEQAWPQLVARLEGIADATVATAGVNA
ncbi:glycosyltransferase family 4 protein [Sphingomonas jatrophae]|uniref:Glycosyltransferase involved in cell wall bisynthesis n=1 Tax=Sphingomonas jatrophae TaxID=1166337 RepID=A0A1I6M5K3_9SPHN|nr:glycosyltransferase [Sphingomonas jatrophae]SFS10990.1 Glycosyltransferase involved in cell wall bisynthesis [Sphingomonas jatrophae]